MHYTTVLGYGNCTHGAMQLVGAGSIGRVEVCLGQTQGTVCVSTFINLFYPTKQELHCILLIRLSLGISLMRSK